MNDKTGAQASAVSGSRFASRRRATRAAAAAPNSRTIGGAGTGTPPVEVDVEPPLEVDELLLELLDELELLDVEVELPPKLDELVEELVDTLPLDEEVDDTLPDEVEVELPPVDVEVELPPVEVELPPVDVELPPVEVELPPVELPPVEVEVEPPVLVDDTMTLLLLPLRALAKALENRLAEKKPLAKADELLSAATTTGTPAKPDDDGTIGGIGGGGTGIGMGGVCAMVRVVTAWEGAATQAVRRTVRRTTRRCAVRRCWTAGPLVR